MKKILGGSLKFLGLSFKTGHLLVSIILILYLSYVLGGKDFLRGSWGTDLQSAFAIAGWVDKYFPKVPFWYPIVGGGVSITHSYPVFSFFLVSFLHRLSGASLIQSFAWLGLLSVPAMAIGVYIFGSIKLKNQTAGFMAAVFYLASPLAWTWLVDWGFYAEAVSHIFVAPAIIFWDLFFTEYFDLQNRTKVIIFFLLAAIFISLTTITHFGSGMGVIGFLCFYPLARLIGKKDRIKTLIHGLVAVFLVSFLTGLLSMASVFPYYSYTKSAAYGSLSGGSSFEQVKEGAMSPFKVLGFKKSVITTVNGPSVFEATKNISFTAIVSILALVGIILSVVSPNFRALGLFMTFSVFLTTNAKFGYFAVKYIPFPLNAFMSLRWSFVPLRIVLPVLAAYALWFPLNLLLFWAKGRILGLFRYLFVSVGILFLGGFLLYQYGYLPEPKGLPLNYGAMGLDFRNIYNVNLIMKAKPDDIVIDKDICNARNIFKYLNDRSSQEAFVAEGINAWCDSSTAAYFPAWTVNGWCGKADQKNLPVVCSLSKQTKQSVEEFWDNCRVNSSYHDLCSLRYKSLWEQFMDFNWKNPSQYLDLKVTENYMDIGDFNNLIKRENPQARVDYSPYHAHLGMAGPYVNINNELSQLFNYTIGASSLNQRFDNYKTSAFFIKNSAYGNSTEMIDNFTHWYGLNYLFINDKADMKLLKDSGWEDWNNFYDEVGTVLKYSQQNTLVEFTNKPAVLVVGQNKYYAYDTVFLSSAYGILPYKNAYLVWGKNSIDEYSLDEISKFKTIILYSYSYKNKSKTDRLLESYVKAGGNLFIDTGIQYKTPDWQTKPNEGTLKILPAKTMTWTSVKKTDTYSVNQDTFTSGVDISKLNPMVYGNTIWGISSFDSKDMRSWTKPILSIGKSPILTYGELGKGKVVWAGFNPFGHMKQTNGINGDEMKLLSNVFSWLMSNNQPSQTVPVSYHRDNPDKVVFDIQDNMADGGYLLWKEAYYSGFTASLLSGGKLTPIKEIYRSGPGWVLIRIPRLSKGDQIVYEYRKPIIESVWLTVSYLTLLVILLVVLETIIFQKKSYTLKGMMFLSNYLDSLPGKFRKKTGSWWNSDKEYE